MDVGDPSNFARILDLYGNSASLIRQDIAGCRYTDEEIGRTISSPYDKYGYLADPHGACGYQGLTDLLSDGETGIFLETAHPAKFKDTVEKIIGKPVEIPERLKDFMKKEKKSIKMTNRFEDFKEYLESRR